MLPEERPASSGAPGVGGVGGARLLTGRLLDGRYRVEELVAVGGMATVYVATDERLDRTVAVKVMHPSLVDEVTGSSAFAERFVREARAAARLSHPNVVAVHDQGSDAGVTFLVMELVRGTTLRDVVREQAPLGPSRALSLLQPVVAAVAAAHRAGIVHRDVKPENVLIADDGRVKVADFGLARAIDADSHHTTTGGVLIGTVSYLAPELVAEGTADARADVYALGVVLYELLTGEKPHQGETPIQVAYKHVHADVPPPSARVPGIPPYVDALVARATARDRSQRPSDAGVLLHHVRRVGHALAEGVRDDPDLTADLRPRPAGAYGGAGSGADSGADDDTGELEALEELRGAGFADAELYPALAQASGAGLEALPDATQRIDLAEATVVRRGLRDGATTTYGGTGWQHPGDGPDGPGGGYDDGRDDGRDDGHDGYDHEDHEAPRRRRGPLVLGMLVILALVAAGLYGWNEWRTVPAPRLLDMTVAEATAAAEADGFEVEVGPAAYSDTVAADLVVATDPEGGEQVARGATITLTASLGPRTVPELLGRSEQEARALLEDRGLEYVAGEAAYSEEVAAGQVLSSDPEPGDVVREDEPVTVVLSLGRRPIEVTDLSGRTVDEARSTLETGDPAIDGDELAVEVVEEFSDSVPAGVVISQDPASGTLYRGDTVTLTVSKGPELVTIPSGLIGDRVEDARAELEALGLVVEEQGLLGADRRIGYVTSVSPGGGERVRRGTTVTLTVL